MFEPDYKQAHDAKKWLFDVPELTVVNKGVGGSERTESYQSNGSGGTFLSSKKTDANIEITSLDDEIAEKISFIKMDIEGMEAEALKGASGHIREDYPILTICVYHRDNDMFELPRLIDGLHEGYRMYLRHYEPRPYETVLYCIPNDRLIEA